MSNIYKKSFLNKNLVLTKFIETYKLNNKHLKIHNKTLSGTPGRYKIMLDRNKNWIKNSGKSIKLAAPGKDIKLQLTLEEIRKWRRK